MKITQDAWVISTVSGYCIPFDTAPVQSRIPHEIPFSVDQQSIVDNEVADLLTKGAIVPSFHEQNEFISTLFIVPKPNGKFRPIINLKYLNNFVHYDHFKQETFQVVLDLLQEKDFMTSIDLKDAYFSVSIHPDFQKYLKFSWKGNLYKFVCLPFGLKSAPFVFTKILKPVFSWFRYQGFRCMYYIDDSLNMDKDRMVCHNNTMTMLQTFQTLGFSANLLKSVFQPSQRIVFFGFLIDSVLFKVFLIQDKVQKIIHKCKSLLEKTVIVVRELASLIGSIVNAFYAVLEAPLHYRSLERNKLIGLGNDMNFDNHVTLSENSKNELKWWIDNLENKNGKRIRPIDVSAFCISDASTAGWGAIDLVGNKCANGRWTQQESVFPINYLELLAIFYALQSFYSNAMDIHVQIQSDNICAITYINDMGGMSSKRLDFLSGEIWQWCLNKNIYISAVHVPGPENLADFYSRNFSDSTEWKLKEAIFERLCKQFFVPDIDMFASRLNHQVTRFVSWFPEPGAFHCNAFTLDWSSYNSYLFPPFNLVGKVINKIVRDKVHRALIVFPYWTSQSWFPLLLNCLVTFPVRLPRHNDILFLPHSGRCHPLAKNLKIFAAIVSGDPYFIEEFQNQLPTLSSVHGSQEPGSNIPMHGSTGLFGTISGHQVHFTQLKK